MHYDCLAPMSCYKCDGRDVPFPATTIAQISTCIGSAIAHLKIVLTTKMASRFFDTCDVGRNDVSR